MSSSDDFKVKGKQQNKESELYIWVINPTGEVTFRSSDLKPLWQQQNILLADLVNSSREAIGVRGRGLEVVAKVDGASQGERFQQLHQLLIEPIADLLPYCQHLGKSRSNCLAPGVEQEAQVIAPLLNTKPLIGKDATKAAIVRQLPSSRIIHMATHGMALSESSERWLLREGSPDWVQRSRTKRRQ